MMDPNQPQEDAQKSGAGKKKNKKNVNKNVPTDQQQKSDTINVKNLQQQKSQEHSKPHQEQSTAGKDEFPQMSQSTKKKQSAKQKPEEKQNTPKDTKQPEPESGQKSKSKDKKDFPQTSQSTPQKQSTKQKSEEKQNTQKKQKQPAPESSQKSKTKDDAKPSAKPVPSVLPEGGNQQIEQKIQILKNNLCIPKRRTPKSAGTAGRLTKVEVNHLPLNLDKFYKKTVYHMDVQFNPELPKKLLRTALEEFNRIHYPKVSIAFDGRRNMYTAKELKGKSGLVSVLNEENNKTMDFTIVTSVVNTVNMSKIEEYLKHGSSNNTPGDAFQALDTILKNRPFSLRFTNFGRSFFPVPRITPVDLGEGMELWKGFFQSPVMGWKPYLNIDVAHKGFPKYQPLTTYITDDMHCNLNAEMDRRSINNLTSYVKGLKVDFLVPNQPNTKRSFKVVGLLGTASKFTFEMEIPNKGKQNISVEKYFKLVRNYTIKYPNLPCLHVGNIEKKTAVPIELCTVQKGQLRMKKLTENQTANMVKNSARPPQDRKNTIYNCIADIKYNQDPVLKEFGIEVEEKFASVPARILNQPSLSYFHNKEIKPTSGVWKADKFSSPVELKSWIVLNLDERTNIGSIKNFEKELMNNGRGLNVAVSPMKPVQTYIVSRNCNINEVQKQLAKIFETLKTVVDLIVVVIPDCPPGLYAIVKQSSELLTGVLTQCIKSRTMFRMNPSTSSNILLKINSKLNGINHTLHARSSPKCMFESIIFGADVTHPSPDQTAIPSVAAVAASYDLHGSQYSMECRLQSPKVEIIQELENIIHLQLLKFKEKTKVIPKKIFYFRDGVSEGQFLQLLEYELVAIRRACMRLNVNYKPSITFLVVQKRHHTRIFPTSSIDMDGKFNNVPSGTVIDTSITHPTELDFYLCSHASIQGTSRPTKYHVIWDDNNLTEDQIEELTFYLCFLFVRCTRSVSYPAPTYYAHLAAFRARAYIENKIINLNRLDEEQSKIKLNSSFVKNTPMFFV